MDMTLRLPADRILRSRMPSSCSASRATSTSLSAENPGPPCSHRRSHHFRFGPRSGHHAGQRILPGAAHCQGARSQRGSGSPGNSTAHGWTHFRCARRAARKRSRTQPGSRPALKIASAGLPWKIGGGSHPPPPFSRSHPLFKPHHSTSLLPRNIIVFHTLLARWVSPDARIALHHLLQRHALS